MSRRTKLLTAALFLVLLGTVSVYGVYAWRPENPLRFRALAFEYDGEQIDWRGQRTVFRVEVENTSATPIHLMHAMLCTVRGGFITQEHGEISPGSQFAQGGQKPVTDFLDIPPHRTVVFTAITENGGTRDPALASGHVEVLYICYSSLRLKSLGLLAELSFYLPDHVRRELWREDTRWEQALLEVPSSPHVAAHP